MYRRRVSRSVSTVRSASWSTHQRHTSAPPGIRGLTLLQRSAVRAVSATSGQRPSVAHGVGVNPRSLARASHISANRSNEASPRNWAAAKTAKRLLVAAVAVRVCVVPLAAAQETKPVTPEAMLSMSELTAGQPVSTSPDGRFVSYVAREPGRNVRETVAAGPGEGTSRRLLQTGRPEIAGSQVWVQSLDAGTRRAAITRGRGNSWAPAWSPRGHELAFFWDYSGTVGIWLWNPDRTPALRRLTSRAVSTLLNGRIRWSSDGRSIILASPARDVLVQAPAGDTSETRPPHGSEPLTVEVRRAGLPTATAKGDGTEQSGVKVPGIEAELCIADVQTGRVRILARDHEIDWAAPSPNGQLVAYVAMREYSRPGGRRYQAYYDLLVVPTTGGVPRLIASGLPLYPLGGAVLRWSLDSRMIAYRTEGLESQRGLTIASISPAPAVSAPVTFPSATVSAGPVWDASSKAVYAGSKSRLWRIDAVTGHGIMVARLPGKVISHILTSGSHDYRWSPDAGRSLVVLAVDDTTRAGGFYRIDVASGQVAALYEPGRQVGPSTDLFGADLTTSVAPADARILFAAQSVSEPQEIWIADRGFRSVRRISNLGAGVAGASMGRREFVHWHSSGGEPHSGLLLLPSNHRPGMRHPLIVWVYESSTPYASTFGLTGQQFFNLQLFATRGYLVFYPDLTWKRESVMAGIAEQVTSGIRELVRLGIADSTRVGVVGHSSGGYDVLALVVSVPWLRAAIAVAGVSDMLSQWGSTIDSRAGYEWAENQMGLGGPPWKYPERYVANSPSYHFDRVQTPVLLLQGTADEMVSARQMDLAFAELRYLGKPVEYRRYQGEGHGPDDWTLSDRMDAVQRMLEWCETYLRPSN